MNLRPETIIALHNFCDLMPVSSALKQSSKPFVVAEAEKLLGEGITEDEILRVITQNDAATEHSDRMKNN